MARESKFTKSDLYEATKELLLQHGYTGFHFGLLADELKISRAALYKYFGNKDELITEYMAFEMEQFLHDLEKIKDYPYFKEQLTYLLEIIFKYSRIHQILSMIFQIPQSDHAKVNESLKKLKSQHDQMYFYLKDFIQLGRKEKLLKPEFPDHLILGFIFESVTIPNYSKLPDRQWKNLVLELLCQGMLVENS